MNTEEKVSALRHTLVSRGWIDVIKPALLAAMSGLQQEWLSGSRSTGREKVTDDMLRGNIISLQWMLGWERQADKLVKELETLQELQRETVPASEGGSPY
jgi:hypothetical protein